ncbi:hypothetical protein I5729_01575 [Acinetobacter bereziniae]|uniref:hypothetical protein n=1 Tax=Acinetobacter bereziniae TaxID=106648 RepID=UPI0019006FB9|nr:hypothetical protein [Acinetobacter bereziniae]MBJ9947806.1 hypothetical protein [Acinetobacter bereziniae]
MILLIDDKSNIPKDLKNAIIRIDPNLEHIIDVWSPDNESNLLDLYITNKGNPSRDSGADEDIWRRVLEQQEVEMVVIDHDLSSLKVRISESAITNACKQLAIPVCTYHRKPPQNDSQNLKDRVNQARSFSIEIDIDEDTHYERCALEIIDVFYGFKSISEEFSKLDANTLQGGPAKIISVILKKPQLESLFARYTSSSTLAADIIQYDEDAPEDQISDILNKRIPFILGCWLYNYVLPFPGIILNTIAAASYINLNVSQFQENSNEFESAKYDGPFSKNFSFWWRHDLDQILFDADAEDAVNYLNNKGKIGILPCKCSVDNESDAGYYCIVKKLPISHTESIGHLSWIPQGADLCRINKKIYRRLAPMMGL